jgi:hypothetical protein
VTDGEKIRSHRERLGAEQDARSRPLRRYELAGILALFELAKKDARPSR